MNKKYDVISLIGLHIEAEEVCLCAEHKEKVESAGYQAIECRETTDCECVYCTLKDIS